MQSQGEKCEKDQTFSYNVLESVYDTSPKEKSFAISSKNCVLKCLSEDNLLELIVYEEEEMPGQGEGRRQDVEGKVKPK